MNPAESPLESLDEVIDEEIYSLEDGSGDEQTIAAVGAVYYF